MNVELPNQDSKVQHSKFKISTTVYPRTHFYLALIPLHAISEEFVLFVPLSAGLASNKEASPAAIYVDHVLRDHYQEFFDQVWRSLLVS